MDLRICLNCGYIWDACDEWVARSMCHLCRINKMPSENVEDLGKVILKLRQENLLHHGKLK